MSSTSSGVDHACRCGLGCTEVVHAGHLVRDDGRDARVHGLQRRQAVALRERHIREGARPPVELGEDDVGDRPGEDDVIGRRRVRQFRAPPDGPDDDQRPGSREGVTHPAEGPHEPIHVLARLERAHGEEELARDAQLRQEGVGGGGIGRRQVVGATGHPR